MRSIKEFINEALTGDTIGDLYNFQPKRSMDKDFEAKYIPMNFLDVNKLKKDIKTSYNGSDQGELAYYSIIEILNSTKFDKNTKNLEKTIDNVFTKYLLKNVKFESYVEINGHSMDIQLIYTTPTIRGNGNRTLGGREILRFVFDEK